MLQKAQSKNIWKLKYLALAPILLGILFYTSCETDPTKDTLSDTEGVVIQGDGIVIKVGDIENLTQAEENRVYSKLKELSQSNGPWELQVIDGETTVSFADTEKDVFITGMHNEPIQAQMTIDFKDPQKFYKNFSASKGKPFDWKELYRNENKVPFIMVDEVPVFPGCEDASDPRACFQQMMQKHISKHFNYPKEAQEKGIQGRVSVLFIIQENGSIGNLRMRGPDALLEEEAARIIGTLPRMKPGRYEGKPVNVPFSLPITFKLASSNIDGSDASKNTAKRMEMDEVMTALEMVPFAAVDTAPILPGCEGATDSKSCFREKLHDHISKHFRYPQEAQEKGIQGRVAILFTIDDKGTIQNLRYRGPDPLLETEAERIIKKLPKMQPAKHQGKETAVVFSIPITFKLQGNLSSREMKVSSSSYDVASSQLYVKITDGSRALPGANVSVMGKPIQEVTDFDGAVTLAAEKGDIVEFQYQGYSNLKFKVAD